MSRAISLSPLRLCWLPRTFPPFGSQQAKLKSGHPIGIKPPEFKNTRLVPGIISAMGYVQALTPCWSIRRSLAASQASGINRGSHKLGGEAEST
jgi:hypothetical protein